MTVIKVNLNKCDNRSYKIIAAEGILNDLRPFIGDGRNDKTKRKYAKTGRRYAVISDSNISRLYGQKIVRLISGCGADAVLLTFKAGEASKRMSTAEKILNRMVELGFTRHDAVISLGGGVTGDLAGFIASVFMRGIPIIHIPTSLLAMVDSSIGGKTGVNLESGKNLTGTFYQPEKVIIDPKVLKTLPENEFINGFAEIIKYSVIADEKLFRLLEKHQKNSLKNDAPVLNNIIVRCAKIKAGITQKDETEKGLRMVLNYGHTTGHAIERYSKYKISHGHAISLGMVIANNIGIMSGILNENHASRIKKLLNAYNLPASPIQIFSDKKTHEKLWEIMQNDKKMRNSKISFVIPNKIGRTEYYNQVNKALFLKSFSVL